VPLPGASDAVGEAGPASHANYAFSEGMTLGNWREFITLQNPGASAVDVVVTLYTGGTVIQKTVELKPHSRSTVDVNALVVPMSRAYNPPGAYEVSASIQALNGSIVAERPLYFQFGTGNPPNKGGTSFPGYTGS
ncbi:MAG: peptidase S53, partial [Ktedonobacteraceae bacterium]|nr:peptidase S53 [Ktedonobacteraceae bacterium]